MKISDFIFKFKSRISGHQDALCRVRIFFNCNSSFAVITDLKEKHYISITNAIEDIRNQLIEKGLIDKKTIVIEHYEQSSIRFYDTFDLVHFDKNNAPSWRPLTRKKIFKLLKCDLFTFGKCTFEDKRLFEQIEYLDNKINSYLDYYVELPKKMQRRQFIKDHMISKDQLIQFINRNPSEREIQNYLQQDLSLFGDAYSSPKNEYICFSQFKLLDGFIDFVVFSGRSRMDVTFIEIKGANFNFRNTSGRGNLSYKTNEALQQARERAGKMIRQYNTLHKYIHSIREQVESGHFIYNSFIGLQDILYVDKNKDINIRLVVISGRSTNDLEESKIRHNIECNSSPPIRLESWDSFLNKLSRN